MIVATAASAADAIATGIVPIRAWADCTGDERKLAIDAVRDVLRGKPHQRGVVFTHVALEAARAAGLVEAPDVTTRAATAGPCT